MSRRNFSEKSRASLAVLALLATGACAEPKKVAKSDSSATSKATQRAAFGDSAKPAEVSSTAARLAAEVPPPATGSVDTGLQLQFPQMDEQQIKDGLPSLRKQLRSAFPDATDAQRQKMVEQAANAMRRGGGVLLTPQ